MLDFPTPVHARVAQEAVDLFGGRRGVEAVLVIASCARGVAVPESDLDMVVLTSPEANRATLEREWSVRTKPLTVHLDVVDGVYAPMPWDDGGGPDGFELEIGNHVAYSVALWEAGDAYRALRERWLPYYDDALRAARLAMVREACERDITAVTFYAGRELYFQAFDRLYKALREFLQALFISRRTYPVAYDKWIRQQMEDLLGEPALYDELASVLTMPKLGRAELIARADALRSLAERYIER
jgi:predicted nucleotidyltransferase